MLVQDQVRTVCLKSTYEGKYSPYSIICNQFIYKGLGRALCLRFAKGGYNVALVSRNAKKTEMVAKEINMKYKEVKTLCVSADSTKADECEAAFKQITDSSNIKRIWM